MGRGRRRKEGGGIGGRREEACALDYLHVPSRLDPSRPLPHHLAGGIADVVENANAMAARTDVTKKTTGAAKRDVDYIAEYTGYVTEYEAARSAAEKSGSAFDDAAVLAKIKSSLGIAAIEAELDAKK